MSGQTSSTIRHYYQQQHELFRNNSREIVQDNIKLFSFLLRTSIFLCILLVLTSFVLPSFHGLKTGYALLMCLYCLIFILYARFRRFVLVWIYTYFCLFFIFTLYLSIVFTPDQCGTSIVGLLCLMPITFLDKSLRVNLFVVVFYITHTFLSYLIKSKPLFLDDLVTCAVAALGGIVIGNKIRSIRLNNFELKRQGEIQKYTDFLSGLSNRRKMFEVLEKCAEAGCEAPVTGIMMLEIDWFKQFNDSYGHLAGDDCLRRLGVCFSKFGQENDLDFFRYGGEEFTAFSYTHDYEELLVLADKLRRSVTALQIPFSHSEKKIVTVSIGTAERKRNGTHSHGQLISMADEALYQAKSSGRNAVAGYTEKTSRETAVQKQISN